MKEPKYNPGLWVVFKMESGGAFGKIRGGSFTADDGWVYVVENAASPGAIFTVAEVDISAESDGGDWTAIA